MLSIYGLGGLGIAIELYGLTQNLLFWQGRGLSFGRLVVDACLLGVFVVSCLWVTAFCIAVVVLVWCCLLGRLPLVCRHLSPWQFYGNKGRSSLVLCGHLGIVSRCDRLGISIQLDGWSLF